jgi:ATP-binding protein involved in chromosome partitioning
MTNQITKEAILAALSKVQEPELHQDLVTLNMIRELEIQGDKVSFTVMLTTPACPLRGKIESEARQAVMSVGGVKEVVIKMDSDVPNDGRMRGLVNMPIRNAIAIGSGKGGVGKSTVSVNIAIALVQAGARVGLMDADIYGPNIPTMLGVEKLPPPQGQRLIPAQAYGIKMVSMGLLVKPGQPLIWRGPMLNSAIRQFLGDVEWGELDYLIVDLPPGTGDAALSLAQALPLSGAVIVTLPQLVSLEDASRGLNMFKRSKCRFWESSRICHILTCLMVRAWISLVRAAVNNWLKPHRRLSSVRFPLIRMCASAATAESQFWCPILIRPWQMPCRRSRKKLPHRSVWRR